jgi:hypothetical protein
MSFQVNEVQRVLNGADYPMSGKQLAELAERNGGSPELVEELSKIDRQVDGPTAVMQELKGDLGGSTPRGNSSEQRDYKDVEGANFQVNEVQKYLKGGDYPMDGDQLATLAQRNGGPDDLVNTLRGLDKVDGPNGVMKQLKEHLGGGPR